MLAVLEEIPFLNFNGVRSSVSFIDLSKLYSKEWYFVSSGWRLNQAHVSWPIIDQSLVAHGLLDAGLGMSSQWDSRFSKACDRSMSLCKWLVSGEMTLKRNILENNAFYLQRSKSYSRSCQQQKAWNGCCVLRLEMLLILWLLGYLYCILWYYNGVCFFPSCSFTSQISLINHSHSLSTLKALQTLCTPPSTSLQRRGGGQTEEDKR